MYTQYAIDSNSPQLSQSSKEKFMQDMDGGKQLLWKLKVGLYNLDILWFQNMSQALFRDLFAM